ncbi:MFS transporter [Lampropedia puyangensis]|uniref:MFS transporter n=1 Tax=Lampropedia puyangensis TaxID=1330072 RepID=A0A4S8F9P7_9BURK|nr:MFS transporter [Lampropedia puyangensis]THU04007.1 MFS transporter [Lampropedia puyangensis]
MIKLDAYAGAAPVVPVSRLVVIVALYLAHALPLYFYSVALPAILRTQGVDLRWIGMLSLLYIPWALKFLWAPYVDRWQIPGLGRRRTWLLISQVAIVLGIATLAVSGFDWGLMAFILIGLAISTFAATQDIAIDGYTVEALEPSQHRLGSMAQSMGIALGSLLAGAGVLWMVDRYGWAPALWSLAALCALTMLAVTGIHESAPATRSQPAPSWLRTLKRPLIRRVLLIIVLYRLVEAPGMAMLNPLLVDYGWSLPQIGLLISVLGASAGMLAAMAAARSLKNQDAEKALWRAGWLRTLLHLLLAALLATLSGDAIKWSLGLWVIAVLAVRYFAMTALYTLFMRVCSKAQAGTDFTVLVCFELLLFFVGGAASGFLAKALGFAGYYAMLAAVSALGLVLCRHWLIHLNEQQEEHPTD